MKARKHTLSMIQWWKDAGISRADLAVRRSDCAMLWHRDVLLDDLPLPWAGAENTRHGEVFIRPARGYPWPLVFLDDVAEEIAFRTARKYDALVVKTSKEGGCHVWLSCSCSLGGYHVSHCHITSMVVGYCTVDVVEPHPKGRITFLTLCGDGQPAADRT